MACSVQCPHVIVSLHLDDDGYGNPLNFYLRVCEVAEWAEHLLRTGKVTEHIMGYGDAPSHNASIQALEVID